MKKVFFTIFKNKYILIFLFSVVAFMPIFIMPGAITYVDMTFPSVMDRFGDGIFTTWVNSTSSNNVGNLSRSLILLPIYFIGLILNFEKTYFITKILFFIPFFINILFSYLLIEFVYKKEESRFNIYLFLVSLLFSLSSWVLNHAWTFYIWFGYASVAALVYFLLKGISLKQYRYIFFASPFLIFVTSSPHTILIFFFIYLLFLFYVLFENKKIKNFLFTLKYLFILALNFIFLNFFWILPYFYIVMNDGGFAPEYLVSEGLIKMFSNNNTILNLLTMNGGWNEASYISLYEENILNLLLIFIPISAAVGLLARKKKYPYLNYFYVLFIIGIFLSCAPLIAPRIYFYFVFDSPISSYVGWAFRSPFRWLGITSLSVPVLVSFLFFTKSKIFNYFNTKKFFLLFITFISLGILYQAVQMYYLKYKPTNFPEDYFSLLSSIDDDQSSIYFPPYALGGYRSTWSQKRLGNFFQQNLYSTSVATNFEVRFIHNYLYDRLINDNVFLGVDKIFEIMGIKYVINDKTVYKDNEIPGSLNKINNPKLKKVYSSNYVDAYEVEEHFELIYLSKNSVLSFGGIDTLKHIAEISRNSSLLSDNSIFFCPDIPKNENFLDEYNKIILSSSENILDLIKPEYLVSPSSYVSGGDPTKDVWVNSSYRDDAQNRLLRQNIKSYQLALGGRYIYSYHRGVVDIPVDINQDEKYKILLRHIPNRIGGEVSVKINGSDYITSTISDRNEAKWSEIYEGKIELDTISISNIYGFNVIDVLAVIPLDEYNIFLNQIDDLMQDKEIDYLVRPAYDVNNYINVVDYKTDKLTISRSSEKFNIDSKELNKLLLTPKYFKNINIYPSINSNFFFFDEKSGELRYDIKGEQSITTNFMQFDLDVKDLSYYDGLNLKMHTNIPYEKISVVYSNGKEKKEWPFLERVNSKDEYTFLFGDRKRDSVDSIHIWLPCDRYQGSCNVKLSGIEFFRINSVLSKQINFIKSSTYELLTDLEYNKNSSNIVLSYDNQEIECKNVNGLVGFMLGHIDKGVHEIKLNLFDGQKIGTIYLHDLNTVKKDNMNIPKIESILKFKKAHKYKIIFDREVEKEVIVFSKEFNNFWVAIDDNGNKLKPKKVLGINNAFYIKNKTKTITIEFWLQRWFYLGLLISGMTFLGCVIYLIADFIKRRRRPKHKQFRNLFNFLKCFQKSKK